MMTLLIILLFIGLLISFYLIALLHMKISKFDQLEIKQKKMMEEMDNAIGAYLSEVKDENDQFIKQLTEKMEKIEHSESKERAKQVEKESSIPPSIVPLERVQHSIRHYAKKSYESMQRTPIEIDKVVDDSERKAQDEDVGREVADERTTIVELAAKGKSIDEIAKELGKGKTEIELILKFT